MLLAAASACPVDAAISTPDLTVFTLVNTNADGFIDTSSDPIVFRIVGGNNGSGLPGMTEWRASAIRSTRLLFEYSYSSLDPPGFDYAAYSVDASSTRLADVSGQSGSATVAVPAGQTVGFQVITLDNTGEPGILTISRLQTTSEAPIPEPGTAMLLSVATALGLVSRRLCLITRWPGN